MLLGSLDLLLNDPASFVRLTVLVVFAVVTALTVHEFSHALVAAGLGDNTARRLGRLSLNPIKHLDPAGAALFLVAGFGWAKPVPVDVHSLARGNFGMALVAAAGPLSNLMLAFLVAVPIKLGLLGWGGPSLGRATYVMSGGLREGLSDIASIVILMNLLLAVFNFIPLAPLDGSRVLGGLLPGRLAARYARLERFGPLILMSLILLDYVFRLGILWSIIGPVVRGLVSVATGY
jgi:Zn-dependent protease